MKKINLVLCSIAFTGLLSLTSCSSDDDNDTPNDVAIAGTYEMTEYNTSSPTDFNQDDTSNTNQMEESDCYDNSDIVFNADNTFTFHVKNIAVNVTDGSFACGEYDASGTWSVVTGSGNTAVITATYENPNGDDVTFTFLKEGNKLTTTNFVTQYPNRNDAGGAIYTVGTVQMIFMKQ